MADLVKHEYIADENQKYLDMVESQYSSKKIFMGVLNKYLEYVDAAVGCAEKIPDWYSLSNAESTGSLSEDVWLDRLGEMVGVSRAYPYFDGVPAVMDNATYKIALAAKIMSNSWDGCYSTFQSKWAEIFGKLGISATCHDNQNMSCTVMVQANLTVEQAALIKSARLFPKPMGVQFDFAEAGRISELAGIFTGAAVAQSFMRIKINVEG